jgi:hypothetical protein
MDPKDYMVIGPKGEMIDSRNMFVLVDERYYAEIFFARIPAPLSKFHKGGDVTGLLWRKNEEINNWVLQFRFRYYKGTRIWDSEDERTWNWVQITNKTQEEARTAIDVVLQSMQMAADILEQAPPPAPDRIPINGDLDRFREIMDERQPDWWHRQPWFAE